MRHIRIAWRPVTSVAFAVWAMSFSNLRAIRTRVRVARASELALAAEADLRGVPRMRAREMLARSD